MFGAEGFEPPTLCAQSRSGVILSLSANCSNFPYTAPRTVPHTSAVEAII
jgi:hypothetical protein